MYLMVCCSSIIESFSRQKITVQATSMFPLRLSSLFRRLAPQFGFYPLLNSIFPEVPESPPLKSAISLFSDFIVFMSPIKLSTSSANSSCAFCILFGQTKGKVDFSSIRSTLRSKSICFDMVSMRRLASFRSNLLAFSRSSSSYLAKTRSWAWMPRVNSCLKALYCELASKDVAY